MHHWKKCTLKLQLSLSHSLKLRRYFTPRWGWKEGGGASKCKLRKKKIIINKHLNEIGIIVSVPRFSTIPERRIFPIEIETVKVILSKKLDRVLHEFLPSFWIGNHWWESTGTLVPSADRQHGLQVFIICFKTGKFCIST